MVVLGDGGGDLGLGPINNAAGLLQYSNASVVSNLYPIVTAW